MRVLATERLAAVGESKGKEIKKLESELMIDDEGSSSRRVWNRMECLVKVLRTRVEWANKGQLRDA